MSQTTLTQPLQDDPLAEVDRHVAEVQQRREDQLRLIARLAKDSPVRTGAQHLLMEIERSLSLCQAHRMLIQHLVEPE
ncbi:hypothetical protein MKK65_08215 [Methylobacterium sp. J-001]|uniref:hypothetical protein n=1 Tax=Methylobacterium sp. J-001 TaxID=2836609 RepID=UPI001FB9FDB9|nr:hypothetical protein [Methylobacterium sp. J-001]MCJ2116563.1 hypothetical protein [Methylobacterium sp. J-001]